ncbi:MAG: hypothetical protein QMB92_07850, partial [Thiopseudomonas sp.]
LQKIRPSPAESLQQCTQPKPDFCSLKTQFLHCFWQSQQDLGSLATFSSTKASVFLSTWLIP